MFLIDIIFIHNVSLCCILQVFMSSFEDAKAKMRKWKVKVMMEIVEC